MFLGYAVGFSELKFNSEPCTTFKSFSCAGVAFQDFFKNKVNQNCSAEWYLDWILLNKQKIFFFINKTRFQTQVLSNAIIRNTQYLQHQVAFRLQTIIHFCCKRVIACQSSISICQVIKHLMQFKTDRWMWIRWRKF